MEQPFDKTRDNIKVRDLEDRDRKELFSKFKDAGGEVINDRSARRRMKIDRDKQKQFIAQMNEKESSNSKKYNQKRTATAARYNKKNTYSSKKKAKNNKRNIAARVIDHFTIKFKLYFLGITNLSNQYILSKFFDRFDVEYKTALIEIQLLYLDLFKKNPSVSNRIIDNIDKMNPLYFELIEMCADIYDRTLTGEILDKYLTYSDDLHKLLDYTNPVTKYFKRLYILYCFQDNIFTAFERAINFQMKFENNKSSDYAAKRKKLRNNLYVTFNKLFPRLYWLFSYYQGEAIPLTDVKRFEEILSITAEQKPGNRVAAAPSVLNADLTHTEPETETKEEKKEKEKLEKEEAKETLKKKHKESIPLNIKRGLMIMAQLDMEKLKKEFIKNELIRNISDTDKVLVSYLLFHEFDKEYSFILTTNKIKYNNLYTESGKVDYRQKFSDLYNKMRSCNDSFTEYFHSVDTYEKARAKRPMSNEQYFQYAKNLSELEKDKIKNGRLVRHAVSTYMNKISDEFSFLLKNMDSEKPVIANPQVMLEFDPSIEGEKKLNGKKVFQAVSQVNDFVSAFSYRLVGNGDLVGDKSSDAAQYEHISQGSAKSKDKKESKDSTESAKSSDKPVESVENVPLEAVEPDTSELKKEVTKKAKEEKSVESEGSILDELNDLL